MFYFLGFLAIVGLVLMLAYLAGWCLTRLVEGGLWVSRQAPVRRTIGLILAILLVIGSALLLGQTRDHLEYAPTQNLQDLQAGDDSASKPAAKTRLKRLAQTANWTVRVHAQTRKPHASQPEDEPQQHRLQRMIPLQLSQHDGTKAEQPIAVSQDDLIPVTPSWVGSDWAKSGFLWKRAVRSGRYASLEEAQQNLDGAIDQAALEYLVREGLASKSSTDTETFTMAPTLPDQLRRMLIVETYTEESTETIAEEEFHLQQVHAMLHFDIRARNRLAEHYGRWVGEGRVWIFGWGAAITMAGLAGGWLLLRVLPGRKQHTAYDLQS